MAGEKVVDAPPKLSSKAGLLSTGIYVLEGEITFYVGDETYRATPGTFVLLPRGVHHSFEFEIDVVRKLLTETPGRIEKHFRAPRFSEPARTLTLPPPPGGASDVAALVEDMARYGVEVVGPLGPPVQE